MKTLKDTNSQIKGEIIKCLGYQDLVNIELVCKGEFKAALTTAWRFLLYQLLESPVASLRKCAVMELKYYISRATSRIEDVEIESKHVKRLDLIRSIYEDHAYTEDIEVILAQWKKFLASSDFSDEKVSIDYKFVFKKSLLGFLEFDGAFRDSPLAFCPRSTKVKFATEAMRSGFAFLMLQIVPNEDSSSDYHLEVTQTFNVDHDSRTFRALYPNSASQLCKAEMRRLILSELREKASWFFFRKPFPEYWSCLKGEPSKSKLSCLLWTPQNESVKFRMMYSSFARAACTTFGVSAAVYHAADLDDFESVMKKAS